MSRRSPETRPTNSTRARALRRWAMAVGGFVLLSLPAPATAAAPEEVLPAIAAIRAEAGVAPLAQRPDLESAMDGIASKIVEGGGFPAFAEILEMQRYGEASGLCGCEYLLETEEPPAPGTLDPAKLAVGYWSTAWTATRNTRELLPLTGVLMDSRTDAIAVRPINDELLMIVASIDRSTAGRLTIWPQVVDATSQMAFVISGAEGEAVFRRGSEVQRSTLDLGRATEGLQLAFGKRYTVQVAGQSTTLRVNRAIGGWKFDASMRPVDRRTWNRIMNRTSIPGARRLVRDFRSVVTVRRGDRRTDCTSSGASCAGLDQDGYSITMHPGHLTTWGDGPKIAWHEFGHVVSSSMLQRDRSLMYKKLQKVRKGRCFPSILPGIVSEFPVRPTCTSTEEVYADQFAFWATGRTRSKSGYTLFRFVPPRLMSAWMSQHAVARAAATGSLRSASAMHRREPR